MTELSKGFTCECGEFHRFPAYVYAHTRDVLLHTCPNCGRKHEIVDLAAWLVDQPDPK